jgi:tetratricopeptide (TPR) repeat protein
LSGCDDPLAAPSSDAERDARAQLFRADAARIAGHHDDAAAIARALEDESIAGDVRATAAVLLGRIAIERGELESAEQYFRSGFVRALEAGRNDIAGDAAVREANLVGIAWRRYDDHAHWAEIARAAFAQAQVPDSDPRVLALLSGDAAVAGGRGDPQRAIALHREALAGVVAAYGDDHPDSLSCRRGLAAALGEAGENEEALAEHREILRLREAVLGADHPAIADTWLNLGSVLNVLGDLDGAVAAHERAYQLLVTHYGQRHSMLPAALEALGGDRMELHDPAGALAFFDRALALQQRLDDGESFHVARMHDRRAHALAQLGFFDEAERAANEAIAMYERTLGSDHIEVSWARAGLASIRSAKLSQ